MKVFSLSLSFPPSTYDGFEFHLFLFLFFSSSLLVSTIFFVTFDWISMSLDGMDRRTDLSLVFRDEKPCGSQIRNDWAPPIVCIGGIGRRARPDGLNRKTWSQWARVLLNGCARSFLVDPLSQSSLSIPDSSTKKGGGGCREWIFGWK